MHQAAAADVITIACIDMMAKVSSDTKDVSSHMSYLVMTLQLCVLSTLLRHA